MTERPAGADLSATIGHKLYFRQAGRLEPSARCLNARSSSSPSCPSQGQTADQSGPTDQRERPQRESGERELTRSADSEHTARRALAVTDIDAGCAPRKNAARLGLVVSPQHVLRRLRVARGGPIRRRLRRRGRRRRAYRVTCSVRRCGRHRAGRRRGRRDGCRLSRRHVERRVVRCRRARRRGDGRRSRGACCRLIGRCIRRRLFGCRRAGCRGGGTRGRRAVIFIPAGDAVIQAVLSVRRLRVGLARLVGISVRAIVAG